MKKSRATSRSTPAVAKPQSPLQLSVEEARRLSAEIQAACPHITKDAEGDNLSQCPACGKIFTPYNEKFLKARNKPTEEQKQSVRKILAVAQRYEKRREWFQQRANAARTQAERFNKQAANVLGAPANFCQHTDEQNNYTHDADGICTLCGLID